MGLMTPGLPRGDRLDHLEVHGIDEHDAAIIFCIDVSLFSVRREGDQSAGDGQL